ncbi:MAG: low specificity L-threonine aldolase [Planctomycetota bacterium]|nr:MAG: low specificity L-threonine aldolase [Planctomycetota bacterium]
MSKGPEILDFRSDTVTRPGAEMRRAMAEAVVGDDVLGDDPTVQDLERRAARRVGKEAALFVPSGTMGNLLAVLVHCRPGDEAIMEERTHSFRYEGGCAARFAGVQVHSFPRSSGIPSLDDVRSRLRNAEDIHQPRSTLLVVENTHNLAGGRVVPKARMDELAALAHEQGMKLHVDGARIFNAATALRLPVSELVAEADSLQFCLSKGLGAPIGSILAGSEAFVAEARRARKALGGGMRQVGVIAAAGILALEEGSARLHEDHARAKRLAREIAEMPGLRVDIEATETNMVLVSVEDPLCDSHVVQACAERGMLFFAIQPQRLRLVLHRDLGDRHVAAALEILHEVSEGLSSGTLEPGDRTNSDAKPWEGLERHR